MSVYFDILWLSWFNAFPFLINLHLKTATFIHWVDSFEHLQETMFIHDVQGVPVAVPFIQFGIGFLRSTIERFLMKTSIFFRDVLLLRLILGGQFMVMLGSLTTPKESPASLSLLHRQLPQSSTHAPCYDSGRVISPLELCPWIDFKRKLTKREGSANVPLNQFRYHLSTSMSSL